jgi:hypothetical protein
MDMQLSTYNIIIQILPSITAILAMLVAAVVAIKSIQRTAEANRISTIHSEMLYCIIDSISCLRKAASLLEDISRKAVYYRVPNNEFVETAFDRYWREIQEISEKFNLIQTKQKFVLPGKLYNKMQKLIDKINEGKDEAKILQPQDNIYPDTDKLKGIVNEINKIYVDFVHSARVFLGVDALGPLSLKGQPILGTEEIK